MLVEATKTLMAMKERGENGDEDQRKRMEAEAHQLEELVEELWAVAEELEALVEGVEGRVEFLAEKGMGEKRDEEVVMLEALASKAQDILRQMMEFLGLL